MIRRWFISIAVLPGMVLVVIPSAIAWFASSLGHPLTFAGPRSIQFWTGLALALIGGFFSIWSAAQFFSHGDGTPAPWDPPKRFVVRGPYQHVRNPMIIGVVLMLFSEALILQSWPIMAWAGLFLAANAIYFPLVEEPALARRFGEEYKEYCRNVRRWIPRVTGWDQ